MLNLDAIRADFPILTTEVHGDLPLVYLDSAATSQKPNSVLDAEADFYREANASVHRGAHALAERATERYEGARRNIANFFAAEAEELVFVRNATEALNLLSVSLLRASLQAQRGETVNPRFVFADGDEILLTEMEHHSNLVPWQMLAEATGAKLKFIGLTAEGRLNLENLDSLIGPRVKLVSIVQQSNILGTINPVEEVFSAADRVGALKVLDACQSAPHRQLNFPQSGADFAVVSGHKMLGPTGIGALLGKNELLNELPPFLGGGSMIETVHLEHSTYAKAPARFEAGTPNAAQAVGWSAAVDYLNQFDWQAVESHLQRLTELALIGLQAIPGVQIVGPKDLVNRGAAISFTVDGIHPHDVGQVLDSRGVAVRTGHHCAWPVCRRYSVPATTRASFYVYNTEAEVEALISGVKAVIEFFGAR